MGERVLVTLGPGAQVAQVVSGLRDLGAADVTEPRPELPDVCVVTLPDDCPDAQDWAGQASALDGVETAEPDHLRWDLES